jgi:hypothetical protein
VEVEVEVEVVEVEVEVVEVEVVEVEGSGSGVEVGVEGGGGNIYLHGRKRSSRHKPAIRGFVTLNYVRLFHGKNFVSLIQNNPVPMK